MLVSFGREAICRRDLICPIFGSTLVNAMYNNTRLGITRSTAREVLHKKIALDRIHEKLQRVPYLFQAYDL